MPSGACVVAYHGKRGTVFRIKYVDADGSQQMETLGSERSGWTEKKAEAELRERLVRVERKGYRRPKKLKFSVYAESWFEQSAAKRGWSRNTSRAYRGAFRRMLPFFGTMAIDGIRPRHVAAFTADALKRYGPATVNQDLNLLHNILASAVREELIEANPAHRPERPKVPDHEFTWRILQPGEVAKVLDSFSDERARLVFLTAILTAMRRHELVNLRWQDVDFLESAIRVRKSKTAEGHRSIAMPRTLSDALWAWRMATPYQADRDWVFASPESGRRLNPDRWWNQHWQAALTKAGVEGYVRPFHDARHSSLTHQAAAGSSPIAIMTAAGHASMATTKRYLHLAGVVFKDEADALERRLLGAKTVETGGRN
jgi:integrase